jgi:ABC-type glycerol-3-phosphate transport system substrate-binding protein
MSRLRWLGVVAIMALVTAACTGDGEEDRDARDTGEQVTLDFWMFEEGYGFLDELVTEFEAEYPNIDIEVTTYPEDQFGVKIDTALAAGRPPDLGLVGPELMNAGVLLPLDDMVQEQGLDLSTFNQGIVGEALGPTESCSFEGQLYCLGSYTGMVALFYNKDMFDAAGVPYPAAWPPMSVEEFVDVACQLTDPENEVWGAAYGDPVTFLPWETVVSSDGRTATGYVNGPTSVSAHEVLARGIQEGCAPSLNILDPWEQGTDYFARGQLAMVVTDFQSLNKIENAGVNYGVTGSPTAEGVDPWFNVWTDSVGVFANTDHPDEAELFIAFMATDGQRLRVQETGDLPLDTAVAEELDWAGGTPGREEGLEVLLNARQGVFVPNRWDAFGPIFDAYGLIVGGEMSAQEALDEAASAIQENLEQAWEAWEEQG